MRHDVKELEGCAVGATDGDLGFVSDIYFDDRQWTIRYLVVETGAWLKGRKVLVSPKAVRRVAWDDEVVAVALTRQQVEDSPGIDTDKPVSRQHEMDFFDYYGYAYYWQGGLAWGAPMCPISAADIPGDLDSGPPAAHGGDPASAGQRRFDGEPETADSHLRSANDVIGHEATASDGHVGSVQSFVFDDQSWAIRHLVLNTANWLPGKRILVSPAQVQRISWRERDVYLDMTREEVEASSRYSHELLAIRETHE